MAALGKVKSVINSAKVRITSATPSTRTAFRESWLHQIQPEARVAACLPFFGSHPLLLMLGVNWSVLEQCDPVSREYAILFLHVFNSAFLSGYNRFRLFLLIRIHS